MIVTYVKDEYFVLHIWPTILWRRPVGSRSATPGSLCKIFSPNSNPDHWVPNWEPVGTIFTYLGMTWPKVEPTTSQSQSGHSIFLPFSPIWNPAAFFSGRHQVKRISQSLTHRWVEIQQKECYFRGGRGLFVLMWNHAATKVSVAACCFGLFVFLSAVWCCENKSLKNL